MKTFAYYKARSLEQAVSLKGEHPEAVFLAGGTDLLVKMKGGQITPQSVIDIGEIDQIRAIEGSATEIFIGAAVKVSCLEKHALLKEKLPSLTGAAFSLGSPQVRNLATIGGNICNASPSADLLPPLYAYDAAMIVCGARGDRRLPIADFLTGPGRTALKSDELLKGVAIPNRAFAGKSVYLKHALKQSMDIAAVNLCVYLEGIAPVTACRIVLGAVGPTPLRAAEAEAFLTGKELDAATVLAAARTARRACRPIDDIRTTAAYREEMVEVLCKRGITAIMQKENGVCCHASY